MQMYYVSNNNNRYLGILMEGQKIMRDKCVYCKKYFNNTREQIVDDWDRLCQWCVDDFEAVDYILPNIQTRKE